MNIKRSLFFWLQRTIGSHAGRRYREIRDTESWTRDQLAAWQQERLNTLLQRSCETVPFYQPYKGAALSDFPILTKAVLADHFKQLMEPSLLREYESGRKPARYSWVQVTSGGTTGTPSTVIHDADFRDQNRAHRVYEYDLCGFPFGTRHFRLWGSMLDINKTKNSAGQRAMSALSGEQFLNAFNMDDQSIVRYLDMLNQSKVDGMVGYIDAVEQLARYARAHHIPVRPVPHIMSAAGTLTPEVRETVQSVFQARVYNKYGSRECGDIACECADGGFHIFSRNVYVEVVDDAGRALPPGERGRLLITLLHNKRFPMIRYDIGDMGALSGRACSCGRPFPLLESVEGRRTDFIRSVQGEYVSPVFIRHVVGVVHGQEKIRRFQMIQKTATDYVLLLEPNTDVDDSVINALVPALKSDILSVLGPGADLTITVQHKIPETKTGKFQYIINEHKAVT